MTIYECICGSYDFPALPSATGEEVIHCYECDAYNRGRQDQLREFIAWGNEPCPHSQIKTGRRPHKRQCSVCWQELIKEAEL